MSPKKHHSQPGERKATKSGRIIPGADHKVIQKTRLKKMRLNRKTQTKIASFFDNFDRERANRCRDCGGRIAVIENADGRVFFASTSRCESKFCQRCASKRARRLRRKYEAGILQLTGQSYDLILLTLTVPNTPTFTRRMLDALFGAWTKLRRQKLFRPIVGALAAAEVKHSSATGYNLHLHIILIGAPISKAEIITAWHKLTGGGIVDIQSWGDDPASASRLLKYVSKPLVADDADSLRQIFEATYDYHLIRASGKILRSQCAAPSGAVAAIAERSIELQPFRLIGVFSIDDPSLDEIINGGTVVARLDNGEQVNTSAPTSTRRGAGGDGSLADRLRLPP